MAKATGPKVRRGKTPPRPKDKKGIKANARVNKDQFVEYDYKGIKMTIKERDARMKLEFIRGMTIQEIAARYGLNEKRVGEIRARDKWVKAKKEFENEKALVTNDTLTQMYAGFKVSVNIKYHAAWEKLMNVLMECFQKKFAIAYK